MSFWDFFNLGKGNENRISEAVAAGKTPPITSVKDMEVYIGCSIKDVDFAKLFVGVMGRIGRDGVIEIKKGGEGHPYQVEYVSSRSATMMSRKERKERKREIMSILGSDKSLSNDAIERHQEELTQLADAYAIMWVNSGNDEDFRLKENVFAAAVEAMTRVCGGHDKSGDSS